MADLEFSGTTGRSLTNNNPLNLEYAPGTYQDKYGAELEPVSKSGEQRFAKFKTMQDGYSAGVDQIRLDQGRGHTLASFVEKFSPPSQNPTAELVSTYAKQLGVDPNTPLSEIPADKLIIPMLARESSTKIKGGGILDTIGNVVSGAVNYFMPKPAYADEGGMAKSYLNRRTATDAATQGDSFGKLAAFLGQPDPANYQTKSTEDRLKALEIPELPPVVAATGGTTASPTAPTPATAAPAAPFANAAEMGDAAGTPMPTASPAEALKEIGRFAATANKAPLEVLNGFAIGLEKSINLAAGQSPDWSWEKSPTGALTAVTSKALELGSPKKLRDEASPITQRIGGLLGGLEAYMIPIKGAGAAGVTLPGATLFQKFGSNLLNFATTDVSQAVGQGGGLEEARSAMVKSIPTAALFTVAQALPFDRAIANPYLVKALESTATGSAFAGSAVINGETDPVELAVNFLTGAGLHLLTSGAPQVKGAGQEASVNPEQYAADFKAKNQIGDQKWAEMQHILDAAGVTGEGWDNVQKKLADLTAYHNSPEGQAAAKKEIAGIARVMTSQDARAAGQRAYENAIAAGHPDEFAQDLAMQVHDNYIAVMSQPEAPKAPLEAPADQNNVPLSTENGTGNEGQVQPARVQVEDVQTAFPNAHVAETPENGGFYVELPNGSVVTVTPNAEIQVDPKVLEQGYGQNRLGEDEYIAGAYKIIGKDAIIGLSKDVPPGEVRPTIKHESFHIAEQLVLTPQEIAAVERQFGDSEGRAKAYEDWNPAEQPNTIFQKIKDFFSNIREKFSPTWEGTFKKVASGEVWNRAATGEKVGDTGYSFKAKMPDSETKSEDGYVYHATNVENAANIAQGKLETHKPWEFTDQGAWPDGATEKRTYWSEKADNVWQFAPEDGAPVILRAKKTDAFTSESTGDIFTRKPVDAKDIEILGEDGQWHPLPEYQGYSVKTRAELNEERKKVLSDKLLRVAGGDPKSPLMGINDAQVQQLWDVQIPVAGVPDKTIGINLARAETGAQIKEIVYRVAQANKLTIDESRRGEITQAETLKLAQECGMDVETLLSRQQGQAYNAEQATAARQLLTASAEKLYALAEAASGVDASPADVAVFRRYLATHSAIQHEVAGMRAEAGRALQAFRIPAGPEAEMTKNLEQLLQGAGGEALSRTMAEQIMALKDSPDPGAMARVAKKAWKATGWDMFLEYYINGLLWSPKTHAANIIGNGIFLSGNVAERKLAGLWSRNIAVGEAEAMMHGMVEGLGDAFRLAATQFVGDKPDIFSKMESRKGNAITSEMLGASGNLGRAVDLLGEIIRLPGRGLTAEDTFFKTIAYRMELNALAHRTAFQEARDQKFKTGTDMTTEQISSRMAEIVNDPPEDLKLGAQDFAKYVTFQNSMGKFGSAITQATAICPALRLILPFVRTPGNIFRVALERTPFAPVLGQFRAEVAAGGASRDLALSRMALGSAVMGVFGTLAAAGLVTGQGPDKKELKEAWQREGNQEYSIKIGDKWLGYDRFDPPGMALGMAADIAKFIHDVPETEAQNLIWMGATSLTHALTSKTFMLQVGQILNGIKDPAHYGHQAIGSLMAGMVPFSSLASTITSATDPGVKYTKDPRWASFGTYINELKKTVPFNPFSSEDLPIKKDRWGNPIIPQRLGAEWFGSGANLFSPVKEDTIKPSPIDAELLKNKTPMGMPSNIIKGVQLTPQEYDRLVTIAGKEIKIDGKSLKPFLDKFVTSSTYRGMKGEGPDSPQMALVRQMTKMFDNLAEMKVRKEFPDLDLQIKAKEKERMSKQFGVPIPGGF